MLHSNTVRLLALILLACNSASVLAQVQDAQATQSARVDNILAGAFRWRVGQPLLEVDSQTLPESPGHPWLAIKDPSIIRYEGRWHLFCTLRKQKAGQGRIRIGHLSFEEWSEASQENWSVLKLTDDYHAAPQIFFFTPHQKWYLIYQAADSARGLPYGPCYSSNPDINDPAGWSLPEPLYRVKPGAKAGLDFWVICDATRAHLFFTSLNGQMWRAETQLENFPAQGWSDPKVVLQADIFEASHTYRLKGLEKYITFIECQDAKRRYFKAFVSDALDGNWLPVAGTRKQPFVSPKNVVNQPESWATSYSHGELLRVGSNEHLEVDPQNLRLLFQGADDREVQGGNYGNIPWRLGLLEMVDP